MNNNKIYNIIRVSDLTPAETIKDLVFFGYDPTKPIEAQSVQIPYTLFQKVFDTKQNNLDAGNLVDFKSNTDGTVTVNVLHDSTKQNLLTNSDGTILLKDKQDGTTDIKALFTDGIQYDSVAGTKVLEVTNRIVTVTATSQTNYIGFVSSLNTIKFVNLSDLQVYFSLDNPQAGSNKIIKDALINQYILPKYCSIEFLKTDNGWLVIGLHGLTYFRDLVDESRTFDYNIITNADGTPKIEEVRDIHEVDESATSLTSTQLNTRYPNATGGFSVVCNGMMYIKSSHYDNKWQSVTLKPVN